MPGALFVRESVIVRKRSSFPMVLLLGFILSACIPETAPAVPTAILPTILPATALPGPAEVSGEFVLTNTSSPGVEVGIETMNMILEYRLSVEDPWKKVEVNCFFDPPLPAVLKDELPVQYECQYENRLPADSEQRVTAEVEIFGSNEVFRLLVNPP
jgi:hypothetical protein